MITIRNLGFTYEDDPVLTGISMEVSAGETVAVLGANGTGKTTFLKLVADLIEPTAGAIARDGVVGFAPEEPHTGLFAESVADEVAFYPRNRGLDAVHRAEDAMREMDVYELRNRGPYELSAGEQRRVSIASVLSGEPDVVALDEPTAGLDRRGERHLGRLLRALDRTILFCTHATDFAYEVADRAVVLADGELLRDGKSRTVLSDETLLDQAGIRVPELITWSRELGFDRLPRDFTEAVRMFEEEYA